MESVIKETEDLRDWGHYEKLSSVPFSKGGEKRYFVALEYITGIQNLFILKEDPPGFFFWVGNEFIPSDEFYGTK